MDYLIISALAIRLDIIDKNVFFIEFPVLKKYICFSFK